MGPLIHTFMIQKVSCFLKKTYSKNVSSLVYDLLFRKTRLKNFFNNTHEECKMCDLWIFSKSLSFGNPLPSVFLFSLTRSSFLLAANSWQKSRLGAPHSMRLARIFQWRKKRLRCRNDKCELCSTSDSCTEPETEGCRVTHYEVRPFGCCPEYGDDGVCQELAEWRHFLNVWTQRKHGLVILMKRWITFQKISPTPSLDKLHKWMKYHLKENALRFSPSKTVNSCFHSS